jgi:hypothetical protein
MTKVHARFWSPPLLAVVLALAVSVPASAAPPTRSTFLLQGTEALADCGSFQVLDDYDVTVEQTIYYDKDGNAVEIHQAIKGTDTYRHSVTGEAITMGSHFMVHFDVATGLNSSTGLKYYLTVPGLGNVLLQVGHSVYNTNTGTWEFVAGPHQLKEGDTADLCAAFS